MFCTKCGTQMPEGANHCPNCGAAVDNGEINFSDVTNYATQKISGAVDVAKEQFDAGVEAYKKAKAERDLKNLAEFIIEPDEEQVAALGSSYLDSWIHGGGFTKEFGILTNKRFYYRGRNFSGGLRFLQSNRQEYSIDLENITATGFVFHQHLWLLILSVATFVISLGVMFISVVEGDGDVTGLGFCILLGALIIFALYAITKKVMYEIHFEGGMLSLNVSKYGGVREVRGFNKKLRAEKDKRK